MRAALYGQHHNSLSIISIVSTAGPTAGPTEQRLQNCITCTNFAISVALANFKHYQLHYLSNPHCPCCVLAFNVKQIAKIPIETFRNLGENHCRACLLLGACVDISTSLIKAFTGRSDLAEIFRMVTRSAWLKTCKRRAKDKGLEPVSWKLIGPQIWN